jgi:hypothetical protein
MPQSFKSGAADPNTPGLDYFPFVSGVPWNRICSQAGMGSNVRCLISFMTVRGNANMMVKTNTVPVEIFLSNNLTIERGSSLSSNDWSKFRIFGVASGGCPSQAININPSPIAPATTPATYESNLKNAFVWLKAGELIFESTTQALTSTPGLVGSVCKSNVSGASITRNLSNRKFLENLGGAYGFTGVFGSPAPGDRPLIRFTYRGFGFSDQRTSS